MRREHAQHSILVVEDDQDIREAVAELLELEGYVVSSASNGQEGLNVLAGLRQPCLVLLDLMMPVLTGYEFLERLRITGTQSLVPVLIMTASHIHELPTGAAGLLRKPVEMAHLLQTVARFCQHS
ncbi:response regulator [Pyxidicoccus parkwayensis]|uniref:Response regulator n=1 Tax=Pyxidicoccus parkwayensis TaxID=2813578 RepID=A0ABX7NXT9_9BACT|nr:response regulator [Pyxidicoccus parkwaysis]QSQ22201.1 response regulator [Pyxidicoccus parkwaysis]